MSGETRTYAAYKEFCGNREQPWVTLCSEAVDWTRQQTTRDQRGLNSTLCPGLHLRGSPSVVPCGRFGRVAGRVPASGQSTTRVLGEFGGGLARRGEVTDDA